jgi:NAD+ synthase (glutamine-hydrolysing)
MRIALAQINAVLGELGGNTDRILAFVGKARDAGAALVAFPELAITGYPPEDLLLNPSFITQSKQCLDEVVRGCSGISAVVGFPDRRQDLYNAAAVIHDGRLLGVYDKMYLPNYGVFDENRYFRAGTEPMILFLGETGIGISICEDIWQPGGPVTAEALLADAQIILNISSSPYHAGKGEARARMLSTRAADHVAVVAFCNLVGGQDELVFDGQSMVFDEHGDLIAQAAQFEEELLVVDVDVERVFRSRLRDPRRRQKGSVAAGQGLAVLRAAQASVEPQSAAPRRVAPALCREGEVYGALCLGLRDYVRKNGFEKVVVGLSGGVDSALSAAIAVDALGSGAVICVSMPGRYSSPETQADAERVAGNLGTKFLTIPIDSIFDSYVQALSGAFAKTTPDVTEENLQARIRGGLLMALSNKFGWLVLATGNKSETSMGYCTLYGDMVGGFAVLKDVPKTLVYDLSGYRNSIGRVIPESVIAREPTAELRPNQKDTDSLPPYPILDPILLAYVENDMTRDEIARMGFDAEVVSRVVNMVDRNEYKRRQAAPGVKITPRAFGKDRRFPITNRFKQG